MPLPDFIKLRTGITELNRVQDQLAAFFKRLEKEIPILTGNIIKDITITHNTTTKVAHGLGRPYQGFIVVKADSPLTPYISSSLTTPNNNKEREIWITTKRYEVNTLEVIQTGTVDLLIF